MKSEYIFAVIIVCLLIGFYLGYEFCSDKVKNAEKQPAINIKTEEVKPIIVTDTLTVVKTKWRTRTIKKIINKIDTVYIDSKFYSANKSWSKSFLFNIPLKREDGLVIDDDILSICLDVNNDIVAEFDSNTKQIGIGNKLVAKLNNKLTNVKIKPNIKFINQKTFLKPFVFIGGGYSNKSLEPSFNAGLAIEINERILINAIYTTNQDYLFNIGGSLW